MKQAQDLYREALKFRKSNLLPNHPDIGITMNNLASLLYGLNRMKEADALYKEDQKL